MARAETLRWRSAVLEGLAVLIGILLAFSIDAAWEVRGQGEETRENLEAIRAELESNRTEVVSSFQSIEANIEEAFLFLQTVAGNGASPTYEQAVEMVSEISPGRSRLLPQTALRDVTSSGGMSQIESRALRRALSEYDRALEDDAIRHAAVIRAYQSMVDYTNAQGGWSAIAWEEIVGVQESKVDFPLQVDAFAANPTYASLLVNRMLVLRDMRVSRRRVLERIDNVLALIDGAV